MKFTEYELGELGEIITGKTPKKSNSTYYDSNEVLFIKPDDIVVNKIKYISTANEFVSSQGAATGRIVGKGTVLVTCIGIIGKIGIVDTDKAIFNQQINAIIPNENLILGKYLAYVLHSMQKMLQDKANAAIVPIVNKSDFSKIKVRVPDLDYQKRVIEVLDKSQKLIDKRQSQIAALDELAQSVFLEMFEDNNYSSKVCIEQIVDSIEAGWSVSGEERKKEEKEIAVLKISAVTKGYFNDKEYKVINPNIEIKKAVYPQKGDILFSRANTRELVGASVIVPKDYKDLILPDKLWKINFRKGIITPEYFHTVINTKGVRNEFSKNATGTSGSMLNISMQKFKEVEINLPLIEKQQLFSTKFIQIQQMKQNLISSQREMNVLYNSLLQKSFKGELFQE